MNVIYKAILKSVPDPLLWSLQTNRLRILCYHGVCDDADSAQPWIPSFFVRESAFEAQLQYLRYNAHVLPLGEAITRLHNGSLPPRSVCITFDDGYANNLLLALPVLRKYQTPATIFLSSAYMESGDFFPFLKLKLIRMLTLPEPRSLLDYKSNPLDLVLQSAGPFWKQIQNQLTAAQLRTLRPMTVDEVRSIDGSLIEFGAHSHTHCILGNETSVRRSLEIRTSIEKIASWTGRPVRLFSYPNGQRNDFNEMDKQALRDAGIQTAVTGIAGSNHKKIDPLELRRYPIGLYHDDDAFRCEVTGMRTAFLAATRRLPS